MYCFDIIYWVGKFLKDKCIYFIFRLNVLKKSCTRYFIFIFLFEPPLKKKTFIKPISLKFLLTVNLYIILTFVQSFIENSVTEKQIITF